MRILYVQDTDWIRRNPIPHTFIAEGLISRGHQVKAIDYEIMWRHEPKKRLLSKKEVFNVSRVIKNSSVEVIRPPIVKIPLLDYFSMLFTYSKEIRNQLRAFRPDVVIGNDILTTYLAFSAARKNGIPTIFYSLDVDHMLIPFKFLRPVGKIIESNNIRNADLVLSVNKGLQEYTVEMGAEPAKTRVLNAGFDPGRFYPEIDGATVRAELGINDLDLVLVFVGWIHRFQGLNEIVTALAEQDSSRVKLLVVGDGDGFSELERIKKQLGLDSQVILTGKVPHDLVPKFIAAGDICLLPSYSTEPIMRRIVPMKIWEYMAMKKPVIAARLPGLVTEFGENNGIIYVDKPEDTIKAALELRRKGRIEKLGAEARAFVENRSWERITVEFESIIRKTIRDNQ